MTAEDSARLAGFALAHAAWSISDLSGEQLLVPFVVVEHDGARELMHFEADTPEAAVAEGKRAVQMLASRVNAWASARDGLLRTRGGDSAQHVLVVEFGYGEGRDPITVIQPYAPSPASGRFCILGDPMITLGGELAGPDEAAVWIRLLHEGVHQHSAVADLWAEWQGGVSPAAES
jgi:hypothetical protein